MPKPNIYATQSFAVSDNGQERLTVKEFIGYIDKSQDIQHTYKGDAFNIRNELFDANAEYEQDADTAKQVEEVNKIIKNTVQKQALFVLNKMSRLCGHDGNLLKDLKAEDITGKRFEELLNKLNDSSSKRFSSEEIMLKAQDFIYESRLEENAGESNPQYFDIIRYDRFCKVQKSFTKNYTAKVVDIMFESFGYTKKEIEDKFGECFKTYGQDENSQKRLKTLREEFIREKMANVPNKDRTAKRFIDECNKTDTAIKSYIFMKMQGADFHIDMPDYGTRQEFDSLACDFIDAQANANEHETEFGIYLNHFATANMTDRELDYKTCADYVYSLKDLHSKRPWRTRFVDYFRYGGENKTIKRIEKKLTEMETVMQNDGYTKDRLSDIKYDNSVYPDYIREKYDSAKRNVFGLSQKQIGQISVKLNGLDNKIIDEEVTQTHIKRDIENNLIETFENSDKEKVNTVRKETEKDFVK